MSGDPIQNAKVADRLRSRSQSSTDTTADQRALVEQLETVLEFLDKPLSEPQGQRTHHPSARKRRGAKAKQDKLQAALFQIFSEQQQRQAIAQELAATQEMVQQLIELVARRDKQLVSARHAWDLLKSRSRQSADELSQRAEELEQTVQQLNHNCRWLEAQLDEARYEARSSQAEQSVAVERLCQTTHIAERLERELSEAQNNLARQTAREVDLQTQFERVTHENEKITGTASECEAALAHQLEAVQTLLQREQQARRETEDAWHNTLRQLEQCRLEIDTIERVNRDREAQFQLEKERLEDGFQAVKAELRQLHVERLATNGFIDRLVEDHDAALVAAKQRQQELQSACDQANVLAETRFLTIKELEAELHQMRGEFAAATAAHAATVTQQERKVNELHVEITRLQQLYSAADEAKETEFAKLRSGMQRATVLLETQRRQLEEAERQLVEEQVACRQHVASQSEQNALVVQLQTKIETLQTRLQKEAAARRKLESRMKKAGSEHGAADPLSLEEAAQKIDQLTDELSAFKKSAKMFRQKSSYKLRLAREEISKLQAQIESLAARQL